MRHLGPCGGGECVCWRWSLGERLAVSGFPVDSRDVPEDPLGWPRYNLDASWAARTWFDDEEVDQAAMAELLAEERAEERAGKELAAEFADHALGRP